MNTTDSTTVTFSQVYNDFKGALTGVGEALKVGAEHVYEVLVMQQVVNSITWLIVMAVSILMCANFILAINNKNEKWIDEDGETILPIGVIRLAQMIVFGLALTISMFYIGDIVTGFINPEYGAIMEIKSFIK